MPVMSSRVSRCRRDGEISEKSIALMLTPCARSFSYVNTPEFACSRFPLANLATKTDLTLWESDLPSNSPADPDSGRAAVVLVLVAAALATTSALRRGLVVPLIACRSRDFRTIPVGRSVHPRYSPSLDSLDSSPLLFHVELWFLCLQPVRTAPGNGV